MKYLFLLILICPFYLCIGQEFEPLRSKGEIPEDFRSSVSVLMDREKTKLIENDFSRKKKKQAEKFVEMNTYKVYNQIRSGNIVFGDDISLLLEKVGNVIVNSNPQLKKYNLRFYTEKSSKVNAYSTHQGIIVVTTGLMARIENEAQLAFVLCHEISHFTEGHMFSTYLKTNRLEKKAWSNSDWKLLTKTKNAISQKNEFESDKKGLELFSKTNYSILGCIEVLKLLKESRYPLFNNLIPQDYFNSAFLEISENIFSTGSPIGREKKSKIKDYIENKEKTKYISHPKINERIEKLILDIAADKKLKDSKVQFNFSKSLFKDITKQARFENVDKDLLNHWYIDVIYNSIGLLEVYPNSQYLNKTLAKGLYGLAKKKNFLKLNRDQAEARKLVEQLDDHFNIQLNESYGNIKYLNENLINNMESRYVTILAVQKLFELNDSTVNRYIEDLIVDLIEVHDLGMSDFDWLLNEKSESVENKNIDTLTDHQLLLEKLELDHTYDTTKVNEFRTAFVHLENINKLQKLFSDYASSTEKNNIELSKSFDNLNYFDLPRNTFGFKKNKVSLNNSTVWDCKSLFKKKKGVKYSKSTNLSDSLNQTVFRVLKDQELNPVDFSSFNMTTTDLEKLVDKSILQDWLKELNYYWYYKIIPMNQNEVDFIADKYNSDGIIFVHSLTESKLDGVKFLGFVVYPYTPYFIVNSLINKDYNYFLAAKINFKTAKFSGYDVREISTKLQTRQYTQVIKTILKK